MRDHLEINVPDMSHIIPRRISVDQVKAMTDAELLAALNGEDGRKGMMTMQFAALITSELQARSIEKAGKPHWSTVPSFWLLVTSVVISLAALVVAVIALPPSQPRLASTSASDQTAQPDQSAPPNSLLTSQSSAPTRAGKQ